MMTMTPMMMMTIPTANIVTHLCEKENWNFHSRRHASKHTTALVMNTPPPLPLPNFNKLLRNSHSIVTTNHQSQKILYKEPPQLNLIYLEIPKKLTQKWKMAMSEVMMKISTASLGKCRRLTSEDASKIDWLQQTETQKKGYMVECLITTPRGKELHLLLSHLWLKPRLVKGWHIVSLLCVTEFELQKWIVDRRHLPGGLANFYEMNEYNTALESAD